MVNHIEGLKKLVDKDNMVSTLKRLDQKKIFSHIDSS